MERIAGTLKLKSGSYRMTVEGAKPGARSPQAEQPRPPEPQPPPLPEDPPAE